MVESHGHGIRWAINTQTLTLSPECHCRLTVLPKSLLTHCTPPPSLFLQKKLQRVKLTDFLLLYFFLEEICTGGLESSWRAVSPRGKHFWCLVSNLLEKNRCQCQLQSVSMQKLASAPVPARDRKLRPRGIHRGLKMEF